MKTNFLFPHKYKRIGWIIFIPALILGLLQLIFGLEPAFLDFTVPAFFVNDIFKENKAFDFIENNWIEEVIGILLIVGSILIAFSKEKFEDEFIAKIRLESLVWATYINYGILLLAFILVYDISFLWVMIFNMFTILIIFIIRYYWLLSKLKNAARYEE